MPAPVSIWTSEACGQQDGWTISSMMIADGEPAEIVALVDEDCDWWEIFSEAELACINILGPGQGGIADVFARMAPSPGGVFRTGEWQASSHGPRLADAAAWAGVSLVTTDPEHSGWGLLVRAKVEWIEIAKGVQALEHRKGRYL